MMVNVSAFASKGVSDFEHGLPGWIVGDEALETGSPLMSHGDVNRGGPEGMLFSIRCRT